MLRDWIFMKVCSRVEIDDALTMWQLIVKGSIRISFYRYLDFYWILPLRQRGGGFWIISFSFQRMQTALAAERWLFVDQVSHFGISCPWLLPFGWAMLQLRLVVSGDP